MNAKAIEELVRPKRWFLAINEYRNGGVVCAWHDDFVRNGYEFIRNQTAMPALTLFGDTLC